MSIKKNFFFNTVLTTSNYIFPLIVYPYISRVLGVEKIGICNFVDSIVNYAVLFSLMGIGILGVREISSNKGLRQGLNETFSSLFYLHAIFTLVILCIYIIVIFTVSALSTYRELLYIGIVKIVFNLFLVEWFYKGIENFKYITIRSILVKCSYVIAILLLVKTKEDYWIYYLLTVCIIFINALFNWTYKRKFVSLSAKYNIRKYLKSNFSLGAYMVLTSFYLSFNVVVLGFVSGDTQVGYYTTASKLFTIILAVFSAFTSVMLPRISFLVAKNDITEIRRLINKSFDLLTMFSLPVIIFSFIYASDIILLISGTGYEGAIIPMRIIIPLILIVGLEQILVIQLLLPLKKDKIVLRNSFWGAILSVVLNVLLVKNLGSIGSAIIWLTAELLILMLAQSYLKRTIQISIPWTRLYKTIICSIPYLIICISINLLDLHHVLRFVLVGILMGLYFVIVNFFIIKNEISSEIIEKVKFLNFIKKENDSKK